MGSHSKKANIHITNKWSPGITQKVLSGKIKTKKIEFDKWLFYNIGSMDQNSKRKEVFLLASCWTLFWPKRKGKRWGGYKSKNDVGIICSVNLKTQNYPNNKIKAPKNHQRAIVRKLKTILEKNWWINLKKEASAQKD